MPSRPASSLASRRLPSEEYGPGIATPVTPRAPSASTASVAVTAESIPPERPSTALENPHLEA
jgi:hypothetical protein